jgi:hypothetical protein
MLSKECRGVIVSAHRHMTGSSDWPFEPPQAIVLDSEIASEVELEENSQAG